MAPARKDTRVASLTTHRTIIRGVNFKPFGSIADISVLEHFYWYLRERGGGESIATQRVSSASDPTMPTDTNNNGACESSQGAASASDVDIGSHVNRMRLLTNGLYLQGNSKTRR
jgi:hypothetical protein